MNLNSIRYSKNERGFVLVAALSALVVLSMIGIAALNTSTVEKNIAHNINLAEKTFYGAEGATEVGIEMIEFNLSCPLGFTGIAGLDDDEPDDFHQIGGLEITDSRFAYDETIADLPWKPEADDLCSGPVNCLNPTDPIKQVYVPSDGARSIRIPGNMNIPVSSRDNQRPPGPNTPHSNIAIYGTTTLAAGSAVHMAAGYEGKAKSVAAGGAAIDYNVFAQTFGINNSEAVIRLGWRHFIGMEGECRPY